ncbi:MAG: DUF456 domain-containing protein [Candidatus Brocadiia bacterium]|nr:DUF456 domain-containing protein [Planctomycetota bacterium]
MAAILETTGAVFGYIVFYLVMLAGMIIIPLGIPGQFIIAFAALGGTLIAGKDALPWWIVLTLFGLAVLAEIIEAIAGMLGASKAKGSFWSSIGAMLGGIIGAVVGSAVLPLIGTLLGAFVGTFAGAYALEYHRTRTVKASATVAKGALIGRIIGSITKVFIALVMIALVTFGLF